MHGIERLEQPHAAIFGIVGFVVGDFVFGAKGTAQGTEDAEFQLGLLAVPPGWRISSCRISSVLVAIITKEIKFV